jgi:hypothetical protein
MDATHRADEQQLLDLLTQHQSLGNGKARALLGWDVATYATARQGLLAKGLLVSGRGRGGSSRLAQPRGSAVGWRVATELADLKTDGLAATGMRNAGQGPRAAKAELC